MPSAVSRRFETQLCCRLLGWPASESGRLCHGHGGHEGGDRRRRALMLTILRRSRATLARITSHVSGVRESRP